MTTFQDGPAQGKTLTLRRSPKFLRVTRDRGLEFDALDMLEDQPRPGETLIAYERVGEAGWMHIHRSGGRGGFQTHAEYKLVDPQPTDAQMRTTEAWRRWTLERAGLDAGKAKGQTGGTNQTNP